MDKRQAGRHVPDGQTTPAPAVGQAELSPASRSAGGLLRRPAVRVLLVIIVAIAAHLPALNAVFLFDTPSQLRGVPTLDDPEALQRIASNHRAVSRLTLAINRTLHGLEPTGYHALNIAIHAANALLLMALVGGLLRHSPEPLARGAGPIALAAALIWAVHPLTTSAVAYTIQRDESLMAMLYLAALYACLRCATSSGPGVWGWGAAAVAASALGMATKEVMITVPAVALLMHRCFVAEGFLPALRQRGLLYLGLAATWGVLWHNQLFQSVVTQGSSVGFGFEGAPPIYYTLTQPVVILHYLRLTFSPYPLVLDYHWMPAESFGEVAWAWGLLGLIVAATLWALWRMPRVGFPMAAALIVLSPTSSIMPLADLAFEHRFYLPLAGVVTGVVALGWWGLSRYRPGPEGRRLGGLITGVVVVALGVTSFARSFDYSDEAHMWRLVIDQVPFNPRAMHSLANVLMEEGETEEALYWYQEAADRWPRWPDPHYNLGRRYLEAGLPEQAASQLSHAVSLRPDSPAYRSSLAQAQMALGQWDAAAETLTSAIALMPDSGDATEKASLYRMLGGCHIHQDAPAEAAAALRRAVEFDPAHASAWSDLGVALQAAGDTAGAETAWRRALEQNPEAIPPRVNLARLFTEAGQVAQAEALLTEAGRLAPNDPLVLRGRGRLAERRGQAKKAIAIYQQLVATGAIDPVTAVRLTWLLATAPDPAVRDVPEAGQWAEALAAMQGEPSPALLATVAAVRARQGQFEEAARLADQAAQRSADAGEQGLAEAFGRHATLYRNNQAFSAEAGEAGIPMPDQPGSWPAGE